MLVFTRGFPTRDDKCWLPSFIVSFILHPFHFIVPPTANLPVMVRRARSHRSLADTLKASGVCGVGLSTALTTAIVHSKENESVHKCPRCWHELKSRCICNILPPLPVPNVKVSTTILMHHKEYLSAASDGKLLPIMCQNCSIVVYNTQGWDEHIKR